ncbi:hypothetical protein EVAR_33386_1 [Eumeta japonica]|uniref:Uncharacterized protein n=1 Tax=Eumeta variegata TaxID=151549 RepID=A0A4C1X1V1_EUMVA|nr:hypothetical protein EVAR_33386_1 [Eumeta japonica]
MRGHQSEAENRGGRYCTTANRCNERMWRLCMKNAKCTATPPRIKYVQFLCAGGFAIYKLQWNRCIASLTSSSPWGTDSLRVDGQRSNSVIGCFKGLRPLSEPLVFNRPSWFFAIPSITGGDGKDNNLQDNNLVIMPLPRTPSLSTMLLCCGNPEEFQRFFAPLTPLCLLAASNEAVKAYGLTAGALVFQGVFSPCESDTPRAPGSTDCP